MSVYRDTDQSPVTFRHPIGTPLFLTVTDSTGATVDSSPDPISSVGGVYTYHVPWSLTQYDAKYTITWTGNNNGFSRKQTFNVVTPIVDLAALRDSFTADMQTPTDAELAELESVVRAIITTYTGQQFGYAVGTVNYIGNGSGKIILKDRIETLLGILGGWSFLPADYPVPVLDGNGSPVLDGSGHPTYTHPNPNGELNLDRAGIIEDGWVLLIEWPEFLTVRESPPMELLQFAPSQDGTIRIPRRFYAQRDRGVQYSIYAELGYAEVPDGVQEAAILLANDYVTGDSGYRDRYLEILKIQQDSFTYHPGAFRGTGNARADLLLGPYRRQNGMIIL